MSRKDFIELLEEFPDDYEKFCYIKEKLIYSNEY